MPRSSMSGSSARSCPVSEDGSGTVHDGAWGAGGVHRESAARAERAARRDHLLRLQGEVGGLAVAQPEANRGPIVGTLAGRRGALTLDGALRLAGDEHEHLPPLVVAEAHLSDLPLGL